MFEHGILIIMMYKFIQLHNDSMILYNTMIVSALPKLFDVLANESCFAGQVLLFP